MTEICVTLSKGTTTELIDQMADLAGIADLFEVRGDLVEDLDLLAILRSKTRPLVFTCRSRSEGGRWDDDDPNRRLKLLEAVKRGYDYVDVELHSGYLDVMMEKTGNGLIVSHHDFDGTPDNLDALYEQMCDKGADIAKLAVMPQSISDVGRLFAFASRVAEGGGIPVVAIAMGPLGIPTRLLGGRYGAPFTFAAPDSGEVAPGQLPAKLMAETYRVREVSDSTRVYGVVGSQAARSLAPHMHNPAFAARGIDAIYVPLQAEALAPFIDALPLLDLAGFSVARPYKTQILEHLQEVDELAALCASANTVLSHDGQLRGSTSDGHGVVRPLRERTELKERQVVILGGGGAARAAAQALVRQGSEVTVAARDAGEAELIAASVGCRAADLADLGTLAWDILINATPVGAAPEEDATLVPAQLHRAETVVLDMVNRPAVTRLLREASEAGATVVQGGEMLLAQGAAQFETWTGLEAPEEAMEQALTAFLSESGSPS